MNNILKFEIKQNLNLTLIWSIAISIFATIYLAMSPIFIDQADIITDLMASLGEDVLKGFGINFESFFTPVGFFSYIGGYLFAALGVQAMMYGLKAFLKEKNNKSTDFLFTKPISRNQIFWGKTTANVLLLALTQIIVITTIMCATNVFNDVDYDQTLMLKQTIVVVPIQWLFLGLGTLISVNLDKFKNIAALAIMTSVGMFILNMLSAIITSDIFTHLSFYSYYNLSEIVSTGEIDGQFLGLTVILLIMMFVSANYIFTHRDIKSP